MRLCLSLLCSLDRNPIVFFYLPTTRPCHFAKVAHHPIHFGLPPALASSLGLCNRICQYGNGFAACSALCKLLSKEGREKRMGKVRPERQPLIHGFANFHDMICFETSTCPFAVNDCVGSEICETLLSCNRVAFIRSVRHQIGLLPHMTQECVPLQRKTEREWMANSPG